MPPGRAGAAVALAGLVAAAQVVLVGTWAALGLVEGRGYSPVRDHISDLGALTARHPAALLGVEGVAGAITIAFAVWALRPALAGPAGGTPVAVWLVALSLPALDDFADAFFRLDCRAADRGCTTALAAGSWHGAVHLGVFAVAAAATLAAPWALVRRMQVLPGWAHLARPARAVGVVIALAMAVAALFTHTAVQGLAQRSLDVVVSAALIALAALVVRQSSW